MGTDRQFTGDGQCERFGVQASIGDELRQSSIDDALAVALLQWVRLSHFDDGVLIRRIDIPKIAATIHKLGNKRHLHVEVRAHRVECTR
jgi:hypothetical protein